jgi:hypothetical protein
MADKPSSSKTHPLTPIVTLLVVTLILGAVSYRVEQYFANNQSLREFFYQLYLFLMGEASLSSVVGYTGSMFLVYLFFAVKIFAIGASFAMIWLIFKVVSKLTVVNKKLRSGLYPPEGVPATNWEGEAAVQYVNPKWNKVRQHIDSENPSDWKLAILEADIILDEMLDKMGYRGETIGEKLKMVEQSDFTTINSAWEAHKIRNSIAHEGSDFLINKREADRVIALFKEVFEEFKFI